MLNIKNNIFKIVFSILLIALTISCDEGGEPDPVNTTTVNYAGDWFIDLKDSDGATVASHVHHYSYNTSANDNTLWIDDKGDGYEIKCKVNVDLTNGSISATASPNIATNYDPTKPTTAVNNPVYATDTVTITEGKIEKGTGLSKSGKIVDKISFKAHFSYDAPGYDILYNGHKRTGFLEDEY